MRLEVLYSAAPLLRGTCANSVWPSSNVTVPVGVPPYWPVTVAVKVTVCPVCDGLGEEVRPVVVGAFCTFCLSGAEVLGRNFESPE